MINPKVKILFFILLAFLSISTISAQRIIVDSLDVQKPIIMKKPTHLLGIRYGYAFTNAQITPTTIQIQGVNSPLNLSILYTYYHPMWGYLDFFGIQTGIKYGTQGFARDPYPDPEQDISNFYQTLTTIEIPLLSAFKFNLGNHFRLLLSVGPFAGYRLLTSRTDGFDCFDNRFDYGVLGGGGVALRLKRFELHLEAHYQFSFSFIYHPEKISSNWWLYSYPYQIGITAGIHFSL